MASSAFGALPEPSSPRFEASSATPGSSSAESAGCENVEACAAEMLAAAKREDLSSAMDSASRMARMPKPQRGDRKLARKLNADGLEELKNRNLPDAAELFTRATQADPGDEEIISNLIYTYTEAGLFSAIEPLFYDGLLLNPRRANIWLLTAVFKQKQKKTDDALQAIWLAWQLSGDKKGLKGLLDKRILEEADEGLKSMYSNARDWVVDGKKPPFGNDDGLKPRPSKTESAPQVVNTAEMRGNYIFVNLDRVEQRGESCFLSFSIVNKSGLSIRRNSISAYVIGENGAVFNKEDRWDPRSGPNPIVDFAQIKASEKISSIREVSGVKCGEVVLFERVHFRDTVTVIEDGVTSGGILKLSSSVPKIRFEWDAEHFDGALRWIREDKEEKRRMQDPAYVLAKRRQQERKACFEGCNAQTRDCALTYRSAASSVCGLAIHGCVTRCEQMPR
jgi:hypothetical protein